MASEVKKSAEIVYSCYYKKSRQGEQFVPEHTLSYLIDGALVLTDGVKVYNVPKGSLRLVKRSQLMKFTKEPSSNGEFKSLSIYLNRDLLKDFSLEYGITPLRRSFENPVSEIKTNPVIESYMHSLLQYHENKEFQTSELTDVKIKELILLMLQTDPDLKNILFDFTDPHKIDLVEFMNRNYHFNVHLERFAYLTGRSLAAFKRDFEKSFNIPPGRWLQQKRLQEAFYLIAKKGKSASDIYLDLGFEDLSHFSFAFKKKYGKAPSKIVG